ncbi:M24 family metallopeptidase [Mesorhizobium sp. M0228]|uniref:M24 family metallopeptidase n=1 Tax=Mesorhizobium sp. M0228 TaxID=2956923 RepID=UPI003334E792
MKSKTSPGSRHDDCDLVRNQARHAGADVYGVFEAFATEWEFGLPSLTAFRIGHGSGRNLTDPPSIAATSKEVLQKAMIIHVKPKYELDGGVFQIEEVAVVTKDGADPISGLSEENFPENGI